MPPTTSVSAGRKACKPCAGAKVRCTWERSEAVPSRRKPQPPICDRCLRLKKSCTAQPPSTRSPPVPRTRFGQLEKRVDDLLQTLQNQDSPHTHHSTINTPSSAASRPSPTEVERGRGSLPTPPQFIIPAAKVHTEDDALWPPDDQADTLLAIYTNCLGHLFPFVVPPSTVASELRGTRPFLFKAMVTAASFHNRDLQKRRARDFTISMTNCILLEGYKSFDALQGLLLHVAWYHCHVKRNSQMTNLMQLSIALLADLELNKPVHANDRRKLIYDVTRSSYGFTNETRHLTNEERRALLGCFYLSSTASTVYRKIDALNFSPHMEDALDQLLACQEQESDILLNYLVQLQRLVQDITQIIPYDEPCGTESRGALLLMHIKLLEKRLSSFQTSLPASLKNHDILSLNFFTARIFLHEVSLYNAPWEGTSKNERLDGLWSCVEAMHDFFQTFYAMADASYITIPYSLWGQLSHALLTSSRICLIEIDGWDKALIDEDKKFLPILRAVMERLDVSQKIAKANWLGEADDAILERVSSKFGWMRKWFEEHTGEKSVRTTEAAMPQNVTVPENSQEIQESIFMDSRFWEDIMTEFHILPEAFMNSIPGPVLY